MGNKPKIELTDGWLHWHDAAGKKGCCDASQISAVSSASPTSTRIAVRNGGGSYVLEGVPYADVCAVLGWGGVA